MTDTCKSVNNKHNSRSIILLCGIGTSLLFNRLILLPDQANASLATHFLAYIKGIGYNT